MADYLRSRQRRGRWFHYYRRDGKEKSLEVHGLPPHDPRVRAAYWEHDGFDRQPKDSVTISELLTLLGIPAAQHTSGNARQVIATSRWR